MPENKPLINIILLRIHYLLYEIKMLLLKGFFIFF